MIGLCIRPDSTQVVHAVEYKHRVHVIAVGTLPPVWDALQRGDYKSIGFYLKEASARFGVAHDEFYIAISDDLFVMDSLTYKVVGDNEDVSQLWLAQMLHVDLDKYEVVIPFEYKRKMQKLVTGCAFEKRLVETLVKATKEAKQHLCLIEPLSFSYLRLLNSWEKEHCILELFQETASIVSFSPIGGCFTLLLPDLCWGNLSQLDSTTRKSRIIRSIVNHDAIAERTFGLANTNIPIRVISPFTNKITDVELINSRVVSESQTYTELFQPLSDLSMSDIYENIAPIGVVHQPSEGMMRSDQNPAN